VTKFALGSLVAFVAVGASLFVIVPRQLRNRQEAFAQFHAKFVTNSILRYEFQPSELQSPITVGSASYRDLEAFVRGRILMAPVVRVKVWARDGTVLFSDETRLIGKRFPPDHDLAEAFAGQTVGSVTNLTDAENVYERSLAPKLYSTYTPLSLPSAGAGTPPAAVVELYQDYAGIQAEVNNLFRTLAATLLIGLSTLYVLLLPITRRVGTTVQEQNVQLEKQAGRLEELLRSEQQRVADLREVNRLKDEFVAISSHELRTPLTSIIGYAKTLRRPEFADDPSSRGEFLQAIERQAVRLHRLVENLLAASHLEVDRSGLSVSPVQLSELFEEAVTALGLAALRIHVSIPPDLPPVPTDRRRLELVVSNLLDNAVKFSPDGTDCELGARREGHDMTIWVKDRGVGIPREQLPKIFDRFYQADSSRTRRYGGVGLGLSLVKDIVRSLGGSIAVQSRPGQGSTFTVTLPLVGPTQRDGQGTPAPDREPALLAEAPSPS
jgi:signal transduction histidine kinase